MNGRSKITIDGKPVTLFFDYGCYKSFILGVVALKDQCISESGNFTERGWALLFQSAYEDHCFDTKIESVYRFNDFYKWVDSAASNEESLAEFKQAVAEWTASQYTTKMVQDFEKKSEELKSQTTI